MRGGRQARHRSTGRARTPWSTRPRRAAPPARPLLLLGVLVVSLLTAATASGAADASDAPAPTPTTARTTVGD